MRSNPSYASAHQYHALALMVCQHHWQDYLETLAKLPHDEDFPSTVASGDRDEPERLLRKFGFCS